MKTETILLCIASAAAAFYFAKASTTPVQPPVKPTPFSDAWWIDLFK